MNWNPTLSHDDLALYAMGLLSEPERATIEAQLQRSPEAREELARLLGDMALYAITSDLHSPPAQARQRLLASLGREKRAQSEPVNHLIDDRDWDDRLAGRFSPMNDRPADRLSVRGSALSRNELAPERSLERNSDRAPERISERSEDQRPPLFSPTHATPAAGFYEPGAAQSSLLRDEEPPRRSAVVSALGWAGWAIAAGLGIFAFTLYQEKRGLQTTIATRDARIRDLSAESSKSQEILAAMNDRTAMEITLTKVGLGAPPDPTARASYSPAHGTIFFIANNMEPVDAGKVYELWIIPADGRDPIPSGTFRPDEHGNVSMITPELPKGVVAKAFGITVEGAAGSAKPTLPIVMVGE